VTYPALSQHITSQNVIVSELMTEDVKQQYDRVILVGMVFELSRCPHNLCVYGKFNRVSYFNV
jgi:hypothetical protein